MWKFSVVVVVLFTLLLTGITQAVLRDVTTPGDTIQGFPAGVPGTDWPAGEAPPFAIDNDVQTKYLNFNGDFNPNVGPTGFRVTP